MNNETVTDALPASVATVSLAQDVVDRLHAAGPALSDLDALILPTQTRDDATYYIADDVDALKTARAVGLKAKYLVDLPGRCFLNEFSAGWVLEMSLAVGQNLAAEGIIVIGRYVYARAQLAVRMGRHAGPAPQIPTSVKIAQLAIDSHGGVGIHGLEVTGSTEGVATTLATILTGRVASTDSQGAVEMPEVMDDDAEVSPS